MEKYVNEKTIIKDNIYDLFNESITCQNCKCIMINPIICLNCQNIFCKKCQEKLKESGENCPGKCENPNIADINPKNNYISKFKFKCIKGCGQEIMFNDINDHYNSNCLAKKIKIKTLTPQEAAEHKKNTGKDIPHITSRYYNYIIFNS